MKHSFDVIVIGSGAAAMTAAIRAHDLGRRVVMIEKAHLFGGTSALSGGTVWFPCNPQMGSDTAQEALTYLRGITAGHAREERLEAYVKAAPEAYAYLTEQGVEFESMAGFPDTFPTFEGAKEGRTMMPRPMDAAELGDDIHKLRVGVRLLDRYSIDVTEANALMSRSSGWMWLLAKIVGRYWLDWPWRRKTTRDRRLTLGAALVGRLHRAARQRGIPLMLDTPMESLMYDAGRVAGVVVRRHGRSITIEARDAVVLACGGFEQDQSLRDQNWPVPSETRWSHTPRDANTGDGLRSATTLGAATEFMAHGWWAQSMQLPSLKEPNQTNTHQMFIDKHHPNSIAVNQNGVRFVNECCSYDLFGQAMVRDYQATNGANAPCWLIFDATYRKHYGVGGIMPSGMMPDRKIPHGWWDLFLFKADTIGALAEKLDMDPQVLERQVALTNGYARSGKDTEFDRGGTAYERMSAGDKRVKPNPCLGPIDTAPYYAVRIDLGDVGNKGGLKASPDGQVLDRDDKPIAGLYAIGNAAGSPFAQDYPGGGGTLGPAVIFGYRAANHIGRSNQPQG